MRHSRRVMELDMKADLVFDSFKEAVPILLTLEKSHLTRGLGHISAFPGPNLKNYG